MISDESIENDKNRENKYKTYGYRYEYILHLHMNASHISNNEATHIFTYGAIHISEKE